MLINISLVDNSCETKPDIAPMLTPIIGPRSGRLLTALVTRSVAFLNMVLVSERFVPNSLAERPRLSRSYALLPFSVVYKSPNALPKPLDFSAASCCARLDARVLVADSLVADSSLLRPLLLEFSIS